MAGRAPMARTGCNFYNEDGRQKRWQGDSKALVLRAFAGGLIGGDMIGFLGMSFRA
jgi:hypothetical protein